MSDLIDSETICLSFGAHVHGWNRLPNLHQHYPFSADVDTKS